ncbi:MAG TPA: endonuclease/exonuclease/phosphatase family protein [Acidimicrobiales bacterium]|nr:endonuclease/exonuclease/phosphatase family protein [Acidimicrobiales bacterium]
MIPPIGLAAARLARLEGRSVVIAAEALTPIWFLPAYAALGLALLARQRALTVVAAVLIALHLSWVLPELRPARALPPGTDGAPHIRIFSANLLYTNTNMAGIASEIRAARPDIVLLQELSPVNFEALRRTGVLDEFPFSMAETRVRPTGTGVFSRLPLTDASMWELGSMLNAKVTVEVGGRPLRIYNVHTNAPFGSPGAPLWEKQLSAIRQAAATDAEGVPLVVAGDFNATHGHRPFRSLLESGLRDAHVERGRGWATTWPNNLGLLPAFARIDHVLVSRRVAVVDITEGTGSGSDHRPLIADLAVVG